jgi:aerobic-type carbon monoxide dehydrogenase small subunit (CoxS/CutS family)
MIVQDIIFSITLNGRATSPSKLPSHWRLIDYLHEIEGLTGTKLGCGAGFCKACTVAMRDEHGVLHAIPACSTSLKACNGWNLLTVEGLANGEDLHPLQSAFLTDGVYQCGYCTPGFLMESHCLLENRKNGLGLEISPEQAVDQALESHLCRCSGYVRYQETLTRIVRMESLHIQPVKTYDKWKLVRWLSQAAEVENLLMLQYLYAAFSVKRPRYKALVGHGHRTPGQPHCILAVAIEEMSHLDTVNRLLVELGAVPNLNHQELPYEPRLYPFTLAFEPLSRKSLAKYILAEAPADLAVRDPILFSELHNASESHKPINNVGSIYANIREELKKYGENTKWDRWQYWDQQLGLIQSEGESDHYEFFLSVYLGTHFVFGGVKDIWSDRYSEAYPSWQINHQTMWQGHAHSLPEGDALELAKLANYHYWLTMCVLEVSYRNSGQFHSLARRHMAGPLLQLCWLLPEKFGILPPLDHSTISFYCGSNEHEQFGYMLSILDKIKEQEMNYKHLLPPAYLKSSWETAQELLSMRDNLIGMLERIRLLNQ